MTKLQIKSRHSPDVQLDVWEPDDLADVYFLLELEIGEEGKEGADLFQVVIATPEGLRRRGAARNGVIEKRATLVISELSWKTVHRAVADIVAACTAPTWNESVLKLQRYFRWEYEDYQRER